MIFIVLPYRCVGIAGCVARVSHVDGLQQLRFCLIRVELKLNGRRDTGRQNTDSTDRWAVRGAVDVQSLNDAANEWRHLLKIWKLNSNWRIQGEYYVGTMSAGCNQTMYYSIKTLK